MSGCLLDSSNQSLPFDPEDPTTEALGKKIDIPENEWNDSLRYEIGQNDHNWFATLDKWKSK